METETLKTNLTHTKNNRSSICKLLAFDLSSLIASMKQSYTWGNCQLNSLVLSKSHDKKVILTAMRKGTEIKYFQTNDPTTFKVIKGKLKFHNSTETIILNEGQFVTIDENTEYNIMTQEFTLILLTISFSLRKVTNS